MAFATSHIIPHFSQDRVVAVAASNSYSLAPPPSIVLTGDDQERIRAYALACILLSNLERHLSPEQATPRGDPHEFPVWYNTLVECAQLPCPQLASESITVWSQVLRQPNAGIVGALRTYILQETTYAHLHHSFSHSLAGLLARSSDMVDRTQTPTTDDQDLVELAARLVDELALPNGQGLAVAPYDVRAHCQERHHRGAAASRHPVPRRGLQSLRAVVAPRERDDDRARVLGQPAADARLAERPAAGRATVGPHLAGGQHHQGRAHPRPVAAGAARSVDLALVVCVPHDVRCAARTLHSAHPQGHHRVGLPLHSARHHQDRQQGHSGAQRAAARDRGGGERCLQGGRRRRRLSQRPERESADHRAQLRRPAGTHGHALRAGPGGTRRRSRVRRMQQGRAGDVGRVPAVHARAHDGSPPRACRLPGAPHPTARAAGARQVGHVVGPRAAGRVVAPPAHGRHAASLEARHLQHRHTSGWRARRTTSRLAQLDCRY